MGKHTLVLDPPAPLTVPAGRCKFAELLELLVPRALRFVDLKVCDRPSARRVQIGIETSADVCLWHSLVAIERLSAHLVRNWIQFPVKHSP